MEALKWKNKYSVGVFEIDAEHKIFLRTIEKIQFAFEHNLKTETIKRLLEELHKYADFHFTSEENVMLANDYPEYESHKNLHNELIQTLANTINFYDVERVDQKQLIEFLIQWFKEHTTTIDLELGKFLRAKDSAQLLVKI